MATLQSSVRSPERGVHAPAFMPAVEAPPYLMAAGVAIGALVLYILTLAPTTQFWTRRSTSPRRIRSASPTRPATRCSW